MLTYPLYNTAVRLAAPLAKMYLRAKPRYRPLLARFKKPKPPPATAPLWIQACSLGEVNAALPLIQALRQHLPDLPILLTASTLIGHEHAQETVRGAAVAWFPVDTRRAVRRFLRVIRPRALVLIEAEFWPNVLRETRRAGLPVILVNGRLSDKHYARFHRVRKWVGPIFENISAAGMQNVLYAERLIALGVPPARVEITGNLKFDAVTTELNPQETARLRAELHIPRDAPVIVFGSTRPGDEQLAMQCWHALRAEWPQLRLILAPRHLERLKDIIAVIDAPYVRRSFLKNTGPGGGEAITILDTVGELTTCYSLATVAVVGGSFFPGVNGHNPLEPAALGIPTVFGPHMNNFREPAQALTSRGAAQQVPPEQLCESLAALLDDPALRERIGTRARNTILDNRGALQHNLDLIIRHLQRPA